jgi:hypothetical protein
MRTILVLIFGCLMASCTQNAEHMTRYHEDGRTKPAIAIASMIDTTTYDCPWSLSEELTSMIVSRIAQNGKIFIHSTPEFPFVENPFGSDLSWIKREFRNEEFAVFLELVEHADVPVLKSNKPPVNLAPQEVSTNLKMAVRVRIIDLRKDTPKIVLQEIIRGSYFIPKTLIPTNYNQTVWGSEEYRKSPMGIAHIQLVEEITSRVSDYLLLAKSQ